ncbi:L,D-transpeptidase family protein [Pontibacter liquoris]|uniref:L,D-transpeptidase family protein n=1 Tax=Pontibacter liquoris TaxID=2905677 RepID=UPI001FA7265E|nr:L,D-transpeptidase family protein [Pontibacter liquoris]
MWIFVLCLVSTPLLYGQALPAPAVVLDAQQQRFLQVIAQYEKLAEAKTWHTFPDTLLLRPGDKNSFVPLLQENLVLAGDLPGEKKSENSVYTPAIEAAVKRFQQRHGLRADGYMGPQTVRAMNIPPYHRLLQLEWSLTRWNAASVHLAQPYVLINIPDYSLQVIDSNRTLLHMAVIVGKPSLPTYPVASKLNMVVLRPEWNVPRSIAVKELLPILRRNPGYLSRKHMQLLKDRSDGSAVRLNPWRINWNNINSSNYNFRIVQLPGSDNELGQVKFLFPNRVAQYMHDTPHKALFQTFPRAYSHGCMRLEKPIQLADYLLKKSFGYSDADVAHLIATSKPNSYIRLRQPLPLVIVYMTAWADEHMQVQFREDVYGWDKIQPILHIK